MQAEIIAIGDELISGQRLDTNSQWLSGQLASLGIQTIRHTTVGDDLEGNIEALRLAARRAQVVVLTGGLGPTLDDLTRQAMAVAFDRPLELNAESLEKIRQMFRKRNRDMPERNQIQAHFPQSSLVIDNPYGSAPGIDLTVEANENTARFFALPGVPAEMKQMWHESVVPRIEEMLGDSRGPLRFHSLKIFGIGESDVEVRLPTLIERARQPSVGITVSRATITLRIAGRAPTESDFQQLIAPTVDEIHAALGDLVFGVGEQELQHVVLDALRAENVRMATLEMGAASWIGDWMLAANGDGQHFAGSLAFPTLDSACHWLTGQPVVSDMDEATCAALAQEVQRRFGVELALVSGIYPSIERMLSQDQAVPTFHAVAFGSSLHFLREELGGHPDVLGPRIAKSGLDAVRRVLLRLPQRS